MARPAPPADPVGLGPALAARLETRRGGLLRALERFLQEPDPSVERVHRLHRDWRRLRGELRIYGRALGPKPAERLRSLERRLAETARRIGEVRDFDIQLGLLEVAGGRGPGAPPEGRAGEMLRRARDGARVGRELLRVYLRADLEAGLFAELRAALARPPGAQGRPIRVADLQAALGRLLARLDRARRRAARKLSTRRAHQVRILLRRARSLLDLAGGLRGTGFPAYPGRLIALQRSLGRLHDLDVLAEWAEGFSAAGQERAGLPQLLEERRALRREMRSTLRSRGTAEAIRRLAPRPA